MKQKNQNVPICLQVFLTITISRTIDSKSEIEVEKIGTSSILEIHSFHNFCLCK